MMNNRSRVCGAPKEHADIVDHSASYPRLARVPRTLSSPRIRNAATFSTTTTRGPSSRTILAKSNHSPLRCPSSPSAFPATLTSWHGKPPQMTSTRSVSGCGHVRTSSHRRTSGQCLARTRFAYSSISTCHRHCIPARSNPRSNPPIPANNEPNVSGLSVAIASFHLYAPLPRMGHSQAASLRVPWGGLVCSVSGCHHAHPRRPVNWKLVLCLVSRSPF